MKSFSKILLIPIIAFILSILLSYSYLDFRYNMSVGVGQAFTAISLAISNNFNVDEYSGSAGFDIINIKNHTYTAYAPFNSVLMGISYFVFRGFLEVFSNIIIIPAGIFEIVENIGLGIPSSLAFMGIGFLLYKLLAKEAISKNVIAIVLVSTLFGTILFNYSVSFFHHIISAFFIFLSFYLIDKKSTNINRFILVGLFSGLAFISEFPTGVFCISFLVYIVYLHLTKVLSLRKMFVILFFYGIGFSVSVIFILFYNYIHFGNPISFSESLLYLQHTSKGAIGHSFTQNPIYGWWGLYLSPLKGLFLISPALVFAFYGLYKYWQFHKSNSILIVTYIVILSTVYGMWPDCFGFSTFGPRFLISIIPFLAYLSAFAILNRSLYIVYFLLTLYGMFICFFNLLDGIPSGTWFTRCRINEYGSLYKAVDYLKSLSRGNTDIAPVILQEIIEK